MLVRLTPPLPEPVTVMASRALVPMFVPVASSPLAPALVIETVPTEAKLTVPALLRRTPVAPLVLTVKFETLNVPVVPSSSSPGCVPAVPVSAMSTSSMVPPPVSPAEPAMPPPLPCGSRMTPRTSLPSSRSITSALFAVKVGLAPGLAGCSMSLPTTRPSCSPIRRSPAFIA